MARSNRDADAAPRPGRHEPVLLKEVINALVPGPGMVYVDLTLGAGGHFIEVARRIGPGGTAVGLDRDRAAIERTQTRLSDGIQGVEIHLVCNAFEEARRVMDELELSEANLILADLGLSSDQLADPGRGFSFLTESPLDMRFDEGQALTADEVVNNYDPDDLLTVIRDYGEERHAKRIVEGISRRRRQRPISTTTELAALITEVAPQRPGQIHPATRTFQGLRIEVNDELGHVQRGLASASDCLAVDGRLAVITFHGLEERVVKQALRPFSRHGDRTDWQVNQVGKLVGPSDEERRRNPRSRSAKLRLYQKTAV